MGQRDTSRIYAVELRGPVLNLDINRIENKQIRNVKNKDLTPFLAFTDRHHNVQKPLANLLEVSWKCTKKVTELFSTFAEVLKWQFTE